jgi:hypothetical protein
VWDGTTNAAGAPAVSVAVIAVAVIVTITVVVDAADNVAVCGDDTAAGTGASGRRCRRL